MWDCCVILLPNQGLTFGVQGKDAAGQPETMRQKDPG
jgi:hypothetical protein